MSDDDKTNIRIAAPKRQNSQGASIVLSYRSASGEVVSQTYNAKVQVGRQRGCDVCLAHELVSRKHADIYPDGNSWYVADLHSSNGTFLDGKRIAQAQLTEGAQLQFGLDGPIIEVQLSGQVAGNATHADTRTVFTPQVAKSSASNQTDSTQSGIHVKWNDLQGTHVEQTFHQSFQIGREASCAIHLVSPLVSRRHAEIILLEDTWQVRDLDSQNGVWVNGKPAKLIKLNAGDIVQFGQGGEQLSIEWIKPDQPATAMPNQAPQQSSQEIVQRYFGDLPDDQVGDHTMMVRKAFRQVQKKQSKRYQGIIAGVLVLLVVSVSIGAYQYLQLQKSKQVAIEMFYNMKTLALQIADVEKTVRASADQQHLQQIAQKKLQIKKMEQEYNEYLKEFSVFGNNMSDEDKVIFQVARLFGECELTMPKEFLREVKKYIEKWQGSKRLANAMRRLEKAGYAELVQQAMTEHELPPQFLYMALQESNFNPKAVGPKTRFGIAKGMWQFIPATAQDYGLAIGPLADRSEYDVQDERFDVAASTYAAAAFLRDIYNTDAQASGLLVMASYNWGPRNIRDRIRKMPENPKERNFWKLLQQHSIPKETYDYVFYIFSAIVIGENPALFGFSYQKPFQ